MNPIAIYALLFAVSFGLSLAGSLFGMRLGQRAGAMAEVNHRSSHTRPTSRLGGIGIAAAFFPVAIFMILHWFFEQPVCAGAPNVWPFSSALIVGGAIAFAAGFADDLGGSRPLVKLAEQVLSVLPLAWGAMQLRGGYWFSPTGMLESFAAAGFALFFINAFNFMDGMDGFAALLAAIASISLSIANWPLEAGRSPTLVAFFLPLIAGASMGFFAVNRPPARVFMGDGGSHLLGLLLGAQVLVASRGGYRATAKEAWQGPDVAGIAVVLTILMPFIFDVTLTLIRRFRRGENLFQAHRSHLYQRLMICGMSHAEVLRLNARYFVFCGALGAFAGAASRPLSEALGFAVSIPLHALAFALAFGAMIHYWRLVLRAEAAASANSKMESR